MAIREVKVNLIERSKFLINGAEVKVKDLIYRLSSDGRGNGFDILAEIPRINQRLGNVEYIELFFDDRQVACGWAIVRNDIMHDWKFSEIVSYSPWWSGVEKWAKSIQGER